MIIIRRGSPVYLNIQSFMHCSVCAVHCTGSLIKISVCNELSKCYKAADQFGTQLHVHMYMYHSVLIIRRSPMSLTCFVKGLIFLEIKLAHIHFLECNWWKKSEYPTFTFGWAFALC